MIISFTDCMGGILRVWSVSRSTPIQNLKIKRTGFHRLEIISLARSDYSGNHDTKHLVENKTGSNHHVSLVCMLGCNFYSQDFQILASESVNLYA